MIDSLEQMEIDVLRRLEMLSEGGTLDTDRPSLHRVHPGSSAPPGVSEDDGLPAHLRPEVSLWAYHSQRLEERRASSASVRLTAIAEAEKDLETSKRRQPAYIDADSAQNSEDRDEAILRWEGKSAEWVAVMENCSFPHVRKLRRLDKRKQSCGHRIEDECHCRALVAA